MPDAPQSAKWLSERERAIAVKRVAQAQLGLKDSKSLKACLVLSTGTDLPQ
jgi:hypothetical protein